MLLPSDNQTTSLSSVSKDVRLIFVRVLIPNEQSGSISTSFMPIINKCHHLNMGTRVRDVMAVISFKQKVVNPHEYALNLLSFESKEESNANPSKNFKSLDSPVMSTTRILEDVYHERQLLDSELIADVLWSMKNMEPTLNLTRRYCNTAEVLLKEDDKAFTQQSSFTQNPLTNFLVYKRKDAKIAWPDSDEEESEEEPEPEDDDDDIPYNPKNLPLGWDGKPIPYWLYKLHGLNISYNCEICGNYTYKGPKAFQRHFAEWRHAHGMRCLGIPNTAHFANVTQIEDAMALWEKLKTQKSEEAFKPDQEEEFEDSQGNVVNKKIFEDLKRQGLL